MARDWLAAWQLSQVASNRLLYELDEVEANLEFWNRRVQRGSHFWFLLLQQVTRLSHGACSRRRAACARSVAAGATP